MVHLATLILVALSIIQNVTHLRGLASYEYQNHIDMLGSFRLETYYRENMIKDNMILADNSRKSVLSYINGKPLGSTKTSYRHQIVDCSNTKLIKESQRSLIDCRPLESFGLNDTQVPVGAGVQKETASTGSNLYTDRFSLRYKQKSLKGIYLESQWFPLRKDSLSKEIDSAIGKLAPTIGEPISPNSNHFYYFELKANIDKLELLGCAGNLLLSLDSTDYSTIPLLDDEILFDLKDFTCNPPDYSQPILSQLFFEGIRTDLTLLYKKSFPYLTLRHTTKSYPLEGFVNYTAEINQEKKNPDDWLEPASYNTTISIKSTSDLLSALNFQLGQTFFNNETSSTEFMYFASKSFVAEVTGVDNSNRFFKQLSITPVVQEWEESSNGPIERDIVEMDDKITTTYMEDKETSEVTLMAKFNKKLIKSPKAGNLMAALWEELAKIYSAFLTTSESVDSKTKRQMGTQNNKHDEL